jgi:DNA-binding transcriptional ArsR family regulator
MPPLPNNPGRRTPFERLRFASVDFLMAQRRIFTGYMTEHYDLRNEEGAVLAHVRLSQLQDKVSTATSLADEVVLSRRTVSKILHRLAGKGLVAGEKRGKEVVYKNPPGFGVPDYLAGDLIAELVAVQLVRSERLKQLVAELDDPQPQRLIDESTNAAQMAAF